jgi:two-component system, NtrC family, nitrogen regulation sensor histidine kinase NtrY
MVYKNFTLTVVIHLIFIIGLALLASYMIFTGQWSFLVIFSIAIIIDSIVLVYSFNRTNRNLAYFFESIENDDTQLRFHAKKKNESLKRLYESMNRVNRLISETKLQNQRNEQYYKALIHQSATGLIAMGPDNKIEIVNEKACELAGIMVPVNFPRLAKKGPELWELLCTIKSGETRTIKIFRNGLYLHLSVCATMLMCYGKETKLISIQDIKHELDAKEMESWQKLISTLTHEIMNSIAPITSLTTTLTKFFKKKDIPIHASEINDEVVKNTIQGLEIIEERGNDLLNFVSNYRRLTKIPPPVITKFSAYEWLTNFKILLREKLEESHVTFDISVDTQADAIHGDRNLLTQVLLNLTYNAIDALMPINDKRKIRITVGLNEQRKVQIIVANNGPAIPAELHDKIFVPFYTTKENGSGIGLSLSRQIIQLHHGYIYLESNDIETRFVIVL